jgi:RNA recognition motif-containing protein
MANKSLYVGNMSYSTQESTIRALFEPYGPIADVRIIGDKGFAFVEIPEENVAAAIEATNGKNVDGRPLTINEARPRTERSDRGGYGRGDRGGYGGGDRGGYGRGGDRGGYGDRGGRY